MVWVGGWQGGGGSTSHCLGFFFNRQVTDNFFFFYKLPPATGHTYSLFILVLVVDAVLSVYA